MGYPTAEGMKITKSQLKQIIQEELSAVLGEEELSEIADAPDKPEVGSPNWCKEAPQKYKNLRRASMSRDYGRNERDDFRTKADLMKAKMEKECPDGTVPTDDNAPPRASTTAKEAGGHTFSSDAGSQQAALDAWRRGE
jgi:hypothetical protein